jgi:hypothetical protein
VLYMSLYSFKLGKKRRDHQIYHHFMQNEEMKKILRIFLLNNSTRKKTVQKVQLIENKHVSKQTERR